MSKLRRYLLCLLLFTSILNATLTKESEAQADEISAGIAISVFDLMAGMALTPFGAWFAVKGWHHNQTSKKVVGLTTAVVGVVAVISGISGIFYFHGLQTGGQTVIVAPGMLTTSPSLPGPAHFRPLITPYSRGATIGFSIPF